MRQPSLLLLGLTFAVALPAQEDPPRYDVPAQAAATARALAERALTSDLAYELLESLTTEVGPRLAGTEAEARARAWGVRTFKALGLANVRVEEFALDLWTRGPSVHEEAAIVAPFPQPLFATSLGGSAGSGDLGVEAEVVYFASYDEFVAADVSVDGKLVYIDDRMVASRTGEGYGWANRKRRDAWHQAEDRGAAGVLVRSVGTDSHRFPHTGMMSFPGDRRPKVPVLAVSAPDADQLERLHERGEKVTIRVETHAGWRGEATSGNVIAEVVGREAPEEIVIIGGHLDSWDLGTGALDDGAGVALTTAAAKLIDDLPVAPRRTIRVVMFGAEEVGLVGARAYAAARRADGTLGDHVIGSESDFGARRVWRFASNVGPWALPALDGIGRQLAPLGILRGGNDAGGGPDMIPLQRAGVPMARLEQNGEDYFDYHHTPDDTLDKVDPGELRQNLAAWVVFAYLAAELPVDFRAGPASD